MQNHTWCMKIVHVRSLIELLIHRFLVRNPFFKDLLYAQYCKHIIQMFSLAVNPIMPLGRDNYLSTLEFLKGVSKSTQAVCLSGDFYSTTSWRWFVYYLRWICSSLHLQRITAVIKLQGQGKGRQGGEGESSSQTCLQWSFTQKRCMIQ